MNMFFNKKAIIVGFSLLASLSTSFAGPVALYLQRQIEMAQPLVATKSIRQGQFIQLIDHNTPSLGTFSQRYYIDETYSKAKNDPVFFYLCGEAECTKRALNGAIRNYAQKYHAKLVALEHRYYGESIPLNTFSTTDLRYLTTEQALDDLAYFQRHLQKSNKWNGKWIAFGGSYPGSLSAYYRLKFPYLVVGSLASSAPVMAKEDFFEYDTHVTHVAGSQCAMQIRHVVREVEATLNNKAKFKQMKALFDASAVNDPVDFLYLIADTAAAAVQYGKRDIFCSALSSSPTPLEGYAEFAKKLYHEMKVSAVEMTAQGAMSEDPGDYKKGVGMRQWYYQSCTEYGYWQNANPDRQQSTRSALIDLAYHHQVCHRLFGLNEPAQTASLNNSFYYPLMDALVSNIYFTNGENDPWSLLSLAEKNGNAVNEKLNYYLIEGSAHCDDLHSPAATDSESLQEARNTMESLIAVWLKS
ncbi:S28 family serine protease [Legionella fallonii]|uniref:Similar to eukaryotic serine carboxypeptidase S28 family protein n=1 Tax=Legionella fallonii LLAP-10 TaxID=1212491 RepID=A0A098G0L5_9GAMM|nr:S28 family serine protease [Legionella fallonii]CEG55509.1 Similar to eukaryotic serine carboxypeptidase S28 family protein [Legionella fallonii LLAP-10]